LLGLGSSVSQAAEARRESFGQLDGQPVPAVVLTNNSGMKARVIAYGATLQELYVADRDGHLADVVLAYPDMVGFLARPLYFGATVGRFANRIAKGTFILDGKRYTLSVNNGANSLHGGLRGFDKALWTLGEISSGAEASATFTYISPDGDQGYPGELTVSVTYALTDGNALITRYRATTTKPTVLSITNHSYFNLAGAGSAHSALDERLTIVADRFTPVDAGLIPTGELRSVAGTAFDFRTARVIGERVRDGNDPQLVAGRGYDHNFILNGGASDQPKLAARLEDAFTGRVMELLTTEPGLQFYSGNFLDGTAVGKEDRIYRAGDAVCLEPQRFPDTPNHPEFPSARLDPGQVYRHVSIYRFTIAPRRTRNP
jgi:aldose 1-epimerase